MELRNLGRTGLQVSRFGLGGMTFGKEADAQASAEIINRYLDAGGNLIDTADGYNGGASEEIIGATLGAARRQLVLLSTKVRFATSSAPNDRGASRRHILDSVRQSLRRLQTDWIDLYQIHCWDPRTPQEETLSTLNDLVRAGTVRYVGVSNYAARHLAKALAITAVRGWESPQLLQPQYSLLSRGAERELLPLCRDEGLAVLAWSPLGGGVLTGKYGRDDELPKGTRAADSAARNSPTMRNRMTPAHFDIVEGVRRIAADLDRPVAEVALNWVAATEGVSTALLGARTPDQLQALLGAASWTMDADTYTRLDELSALPPEYPHDFLAYSAAV